MPDKIQSNNYHDLMHQYFDLNHPFLDQGISIILQKIHKIDQRKLHQHPQQSLIPISKSLYFKLGSQFDGFQRYLNADHQLIFHHLIIQHLDEAPCHALSKLLLTDHNKRLALKTLFEKNQTQLHTQWHGQTTIKIQQNLPMLSAMRSERIVEECIQTFVQLEIKFLKIFDQET